MKRIGCTNSLGCRVLCAAAGVAIAGSMALANPSTNARVGESLKNSGVSAAQPTDMPITALGSALPGQSAEFIGLDGSVCPPGATPEGEGCSLPLPAGGDAFNGGCLFDTVNPPLTTLPIDTFICGEAVFDVDNGIRDTDWYKVTVTTAGDYRLEVLTGGQSVLFGFLGTGGVPFTNPTCATLTISPFVEAAGGGLTPFVTLVPGDYWVFVAASFQPANGTCFDYSVRVASESAFFGACCQPGSFCSEVTAETCTSLGGLFQGEGTDCGSVTCPDIIPPDNQFCEAAQVLVAGDINGADIEGTNLGASAEFGLPLCGGPVSGPAVWYVYDATTLGFQTVTVSTCNTSTLPAGVRNSDTVINVFTNSIPSFCLGTFCCKAGNDDGADPECGLYSEVSFCADPSVDDGQYFILVSGFDGEQGDFLLTVTGDGQSCSTELCIECETSDVPEGEPCPNIPDAFNGGCNSTPNVFSSIALNQTVCGTSQASGGTRDTDWYEIVIPEAGQYEIVYEAGYDGVAGFIGATAGVPLVNPTCAQIAVIAVLTAPGPCTEGVATATLQAGFYWIFAGPLDFEGVSCPDNPDCPGTGLYRLTVRPAAEIIPCPVECPAGAVAECEDCEDQDPEAPAADSCNGGCNNEGAFAAQAIECGDSVCGTITAGSGLRDTDWYEVVVTNPDGAIITATLEAAFNGVVFILDASDCEAVAVLGETGFSSCEGGVSSGEPAIASVGPGTYYVFVSSGNPDGSAIFEGVTCAVNADYVLTVEGDCGDVTPPCPCVADLNGDCVVNAADLGILLNNFGCTGAACVADINDDNTVNAADLGILLNNFGCEG